MITALKKAKVFIVGGFPSPSKKIYGGQVTACNRLIESSFADSYSLRTLDSSQISVPPPHLIVRSLFAFKRIISYSASLIFFRPDVSIIFLGDGASAVEKGVMVCFSRLLRVPVMVFPRAGAIIDQYYSSRWFAVFIRLSIGCSSVFLCQGLSFQKFAINELGFKPESAPVIPNWTASEEHLHIGAQKKYQQKKDCQKILFIGHMEDFKGVLDLLNAILILRKTQISFHVILSGEGGALTTASNFVELHKLQSYVTFTGWIDKKTKAILLDTCEIFVLPSWSEGLPNAMIEAMSAGLACVVTKVGMIEDYVVNGRDALIVNPKDPIGLAEAIKTLLLDQQAREIISKNGSLLARSNFTLESGVRKLSDEVERIYRKNQ